jgi:hypothetical protein
MAHTYKIREDQLPSYAFRQIKLALYIVAPIVIISIALTGNLAVLIVFVALGIGYVLRIQYVRLLRISLLDASLAQTIDKANSNALIELGRARSRSRYNAKDEKEIMYADITKIAFKENEIQVYGKNNDFFTNNDRISIPKELENYEEIKSFFEKLSVQAGIAKS